MGTTKKYAPEVRERAVFLVAIVRPRPRRSDRFQLAGAVGSI